MTKVRIATETIDGYLACTPEPARGLLDKIIAGGSPARADHERLGRPGPARSGVVGRCASRSAAGVERVGPEPPVLHSSEPAHAASTPAAPPLSPAVPIVSEPPSDESLPPPSLPVPPVTIASLSSARASLTPSLAPKVDDGTAEDAGWFALQLDSSGPRRRCCPNRSCPSPCEPRRCGRTPSRRFRPGFPSRRSQKSPKGCPSAAK